MMTNGLSVEQVLEVVSNLDKVKAFANKVGFFKKLVFNELEIIAKDVYGEYWSSVVKNHSEEDIQTLFTKALEEVEFTGLTINSPITWEQFNLSIPDVSPYLEQVKTFEEFITSLNQYVKDLPEPMTTILRGISYAEFGCYDYYSDMPLLQTEAFIEKFHDICPPEEDNYEYIIAPYDLNYEIKFAFETETEAKEYAEEIAPSVVWHWTKKTIKEIASF